jgi:hypothetical protein
MLIILSSVSVYAQTNDTTVVRIKSDDTTLVKQKSKDTLVKFDNNKILKNNVISRYSDTISYDSYIWNDKRNLGEILNERSGYYVNSFGTGSRTSISFNGSREIGIFKDGIQINDIYAGGFDVEIISVNEIEKIEEVSTPLSFLYGTNSRSKAVNIITKDKFQPNLFSQLRYSQDRDGALFADFYMNFPVSRKFNLIFGLNNHGSDGHYNNSDFALWRGRVSLNYYPSEKLNFKFTYAQNKLQRGLNGGLYPFTNSDTLLDPKLASVNIADSYEKLSNFYGNFTVTGKFFKDSLSVTRFNLFSQNSFREFRYGEKGLNPDSIKVSKNYHNIQYGFDLNQNFNIVPFRESSILLLAGVKGLYNFYNFDRTSAVQPDANIGTVFFQNNYLDIYSRADLDYRSFRISAGVKSENFDGKQYLAYGGEVNYKHTFAENIFITLNAGGYDVPGGLGYLQYFYDTFGGSTYASEKIRYYELGFKLNYENFAINATHYGYRNSSSFLNGNYGLTYKSKYVEGYVNINTVDNENADFHGFPEVFVKADISYHNFFFTNHLNLKTGFNVKYFSESPLTGYNQFTNSPTGVYGNYPDNHCKLDMDFYIGARIGKANINLTFANLLNNLIYDTYVYPWDNRGGFLKSLSRFTITWDFWN